MDENDIRTLIKEVRPHQLKGKIGLIRSALDELREELASQAHGEQLLSSFEEIENRIEKYLSVLQEALERLNEAVKNTY